MLPPHSRYYVLLIVLQYAVVLFLPEIKVDRVYILKT